MARTTKKDEKQQAAKRNDIAAALALDAQFFLAANNQLPSPVNARRPQSAAAER